MIKSMQTMVRKWLAGLATLTALAATLQVEPPKLGYSDWPGWTVLEIVLASKQAAAIAAWYPVAGQALKQVPGSKPLFTSHEAPGLIYGVIAVNPANYAQHKDDWAKVVKTFYRCVDYLQDPATHDDANKIMAARVGADPAEYGKNLPGTHFMTIPEAKWSCPAGAGWSSSGILEN